MNVESSNSLPDLFYRNRYAIRVTPSRGLIEQPIDVNEAWSLVGHMVDEERAKFEGEHRGAILDHIIIKLHDRPETP